ncbi:MAG: type III-B CRISPR-associated protein Cas10/Cmr2, partial [Lentisphaerae bacterium]
MTNNPDYWRQKILCFLHDPPPKALDLGRHEEMAWEMVKAMLQGEDEARLKDEAGSLKTADHLASAADRFVFPKGKCSVSWNDKFIFRHPMGKARYPLGEKLKLTGERAEEFVANALGGIDAEDLRLRFFALWRFLRINTVTQTGAGNMALLPADTRIPDHTIWTHMALTSALHGCRLAEDGRIDIKPAFLVFQLGPVQDFIASARSTRDMWSGSYLLSWLTAHAIKAITDVLGPDHILFPAICEQGIFDAIHRESVYEKIRFKGQDGKTDTLWQRLYRDEFYRSNNNRSNNKRFQYQHQLPLEHLLNPTLPNRFVALVPAEKGQCGYSGEELARQAEQAVLSELHQISEACWQHFQTLIQRCVSEENLLNPTQWEDMKKRWDAQVERFPQISWAVFPWEAGYEPAIGKFSKLPINQENPGAEPAKKYTPAEVIKRYHRLATELIPVEDRDERYYSGEGKDRLNLPYGLLWTANYHFADYLMSARRNTREFSQFNTDEHQEGTPKDSLTGKEEIIGSEDLWKALRNSDCKGVFKANELRTGYGAISLIKRLWCRSISGKTDETKSPSYLRCRLGFENNDDFERALGFDSVQEIAQRNKRQGRREPANPYVAVLAMDGDQMGKWVSGENLPNFKCQLAQEARNYLIPYLEKVGTELPRLLTPSYHMQFSEALANFGNFVAPLIIEYYDGQLIYSGGDDLLVMLPAENAVLCAAALRAAFRGEKD